jgi:acid phosphatase
LYRRCLATLVAFACSGSIAAAQTTVTLNTSSRVADTAIRGGSYAGTNFDGHVLFTRASSNAEYQRRSLLDFDTETTIPAGAAIQSATLTLTVHWGDTQASRQIGVYPVTTRFVAHQATWDIATISTPWLKAGGDLGPRATVHGVSNAPGAKAVFDVTALVEKAVSASGSRHSRLALVDVDSLTTGKQGYREYDSMEASNASTRPKLVVVYGRAATALPRFSHVFTIIFENHELTSVIGNSSAPYFNKLAARYGLATDYDAVAHPSLPNYMALTGGKTVFTSDCSGCTTTGTSIADEVEHAGLTWRAYMETMPRPCDTTDAGTYLQKHNPFVHYASIVGNPSRCDAHDIAKTPLLGDLQAGNVAAYTWITPNACNDMHDCSVATGDAWLAKYVPAILASPSWDDNSVIFVVFDEGTTATGGGGRVPLIVVSPRTSSGLRVSTPYTHYNLLATIEQSWGLPRLGKAAGAAVMAEFFR